jgi:hypothetical protein
VQEGEAHADQNGGGDGDSRHALQHAMPSQANRLFANDPVYDERSD